MKTTKWNYLFVFLFAFTLGFLTHWGLSQFKDPDIHVANQERIPVRPDELSAEDLMDALHRDRVAFLRICSGRFERGMKAYHTRHQKSRGCLSKETV